MTRMARTVSNPSSSSNMVVSNIVTDRELRRSGEDAVTCDRIVEITRLAEPVSD